MNIELYRINVDVPPGFLSLQILFEDGEGPNLRSGNITVSMPYGPDTTIGKIKEVALKEAKSFLSGALLQHPLSGA